MANLYQNLQQEVRSSYEDTLRQLMVSNTIRTADAEPLMATPLPEGLDYSTPWRASFVEHQRQLAADYVCSHPLLQYVILSTTLVPAWQKS